MRDFLGIAVSRYSWLPNVPGVCLGLFLLSRDTTAHGAAEIARTPATEPATFLL